MEEKKTGLILTEIHECRNYFRVVRDPFIVGDEAPRTTLLNALENDINELIRAH
jgi:hypothetical protein